jgi:hypothetical protein
MLAAWGVGSAREHRAASAEAAIETAEQLGFPIALEVDSPDIAHKTEAGVVRLNLGDAAQVRTAYSEILANARTYLSALPLDGGAPGRPLARAGVPGVGGGDRAGGNPFGHRAANSPPPRPCTLKAVVNRSAFRLAGPGRPIGSSPSSPVARPPGEDLHPGRLAATEVLWEVAL